MHYELNSKLCNDFDVLEVGKLPPRSYFIPFVSRKEALSCSLLEKRYSSSLVKVLNGMWDFAYYDNPNDLPLDFDTSKVNFDKIDVPSCWQFRGYGKPAYINLRYAFRYNPPKVPTNEPVKGYFSVLDGFKRAPEGEYNHIGLYRTFFEVEKVVNVENVEDISKKYVLSFLGVCSCLELYVNGAFVGYSEESHNTAEFDISNYIKTGQNELVVLVRRWCNGTYLECQDMFRNNGIFRDVLLRISNKAHIWDIDFTTSKHDGLYDATVVVKTKGSLDVSVSLEGFRLSLQETLSANKSTSVPVNKVKEVNEVKEKPNVVYDNTLVFTFKNLEVNEWNAETPNLYDVFIETKEECIHQKVGFKDIGIKGRVFLVNSKAIKLKGVNHHDTNPQNGYCMTPMEIERDVKLCKEFNIDTIRTSHYAPDPLLLELAAQYGLYIVDEVDLETHGVYVQKLPPSMNWLSNNPKWKARYVDRAVRHFNRDKILATPIVMWSLGNESGDGCNTYAMYEYFKSVSNLPVHYESAVHAKRKAYDIASQMYPPVCDVKAAGDGTSKVAKFNDRPYFLCEYAHAMGVGPGNIEGYWKEIYSHESLMGGCVWEMFDHAVLHEDGSYTYGGDHGEWIHDSNFCVDGIFYPSREPSTGAWIVRHAYRPIRISWVEGLKFEIFNTTGFTEGNSFKIAVKLGDLPVFDYVPNVAPLQKIIVDFSSYGIVNGLCTFRTYNKDGLEVGVDQIELGETKLPQVVSLLSDICNSQGAFNKNCNKDANKKALELVKTFAVEPSTILFRAATDNDKPLFRPSPMKKWYSQKEEIFETKNLENGNSVVMSNIIAAGNRFLCVDTYTRCKMHDGFDGAVSISSILHPVSTRGFIPRFGKTFKLNSSFNDVRWFGREKESYIDMKEQSPIEVCSSHVLDMTEPNIRPQESGNRCDTRWVEIENDSLILRFDAIKVPFDLGIKHYSDLELTTMKHRSDEVRTGTYVTLSAFQQGIGTGSCGPYTLKEYMFSAKKDYELNFILSWKKK